MKLLLPALLIAAVVVQDTHCAEAAEESPTGLSVAIVPTKDENGTKTIDRDGLFSVLFADRTDKPIRLWSENCQLGYGTLSFVAKEDERPGSKMYLHERYSWDWKNMPPETITIPPQGTFSWEVTPGAIWGERIWKGVPEPNTGQPVTMQAVFEIKSTDLAKQQGVWIGHITSEPIQALFVDPKLTTPHKYLREDCPRQALRMIEADPLWIIKQDDYQRTPLHVAASCGYPDVVRWLLEHGAHVEAVAYNRFTALHMADEPEVVKLLLKHKANVNAKNVSARTALEERASDIAHQEQTPDFAAECAKKRSVVKILLEAGAEYDIRSASYLGDVERVRVLIKDKSQARDKDAMRAAAMYGRAEIVKLLLDRGADPEDADYGGLTVSYFAIEHPSVLKLLFDAGADPKVVVTYEGSGRGPQGSTLLHEAAKKGAIESVKLLLDRGVNVNPKTPGDFTALHMACSEGNVSMVELLLERKANPTARSSGWTPMSMAADQVRPEQEEDNVRFQAVIRALHRGGVELDLLAAIACDDVKRASDILKADSKQALAKTPTGRPLLHEAVTLDRREIVKLLLDNGCDIDIRSDDDNTGHKGGTALLDAAFWGRPELAELLIQRGANVNAKAEGGVVPLHEAARMNQMEVARLLLKHGADVHANDDSGKTPLNWARSYQENPEMSALLCSNGAHDKKSK